ncbi:hypothetical protein DFP80_107272 [Marinomonas rhizomae]|uniref:Uncharacterized protein n=1 Tax=Marinomonas rhizomae TaxID=491948 RepID=A0A366J8L4_9GAMM|nr:hypothetical protein DFP80_107272 [Marinomonas rhizomae]
MLSQIYAFFRCKLILYAFSTSKIKILNVNEALFIQKSKIVQEIRKPPPHFTYITISLTLKSQLKIYIQHQFL